MTIARKRSKATRIRSLKGLANLRKEDESNEAEETELTDISWANNELRGEESRRRERPLGFSILSINYD